VNNSPLGENSPNLVALNDGDKKSPAFLGRNVQLRFSLAWTVIGQLKMTHFVGSVLLYCEKLFFGGAKKKCFANAIWLDSAGFNPLQGDQIEQLFTFFPPPPPACFSNCSFAFTALLTRMS
jgi:hypothetical protein